MQLLIAYSRSHNWRSVIRVASRSYLHVGETVGHPEFFSFHTSGCMHSPHQSNHALGAYIFYTKGTLQTSTISGQPKKIITSPHFEAGLQTKHMYKRLLETGGHCNLSICGIAFYLFHHLAVETAAGLISQQ